MPEPNQDMSDSRLDELLKAWGEADAASDPGSECPVISVLWLHEAEGQPLGEHAAHVEGCSRCQQRLEIIQGELWVARGRAGQPTRPSLSASMTTVIAVLEDAGNKVRRYKIPFATGGVAIAACILLVFLLLPRPEARAADPLSIALDLESIGEYELAGKAVDQALQEHPKLREALLLKARTLYWQKKTEEAEAILKGILADDPDDWAANYQLFLIYREPDSAQAAAFKQTAEDLMPGTAYAWYLRGLLLRTPGERVEPLSNALELAPTHYRAKMVRAWAYYDLRQYDKMQSDAEGVLELRPAWADAWDTLGVALNRLGRYKEAIEAFTEGIEVDPSDPFLYCHRAHTFVGLKQFDRALDDCETAIRLDPDSKEAYWIKGRVYRFLGQLDKAINSFQRHLQCKPGHGFGHVQLFIALSEAGRSSEAHQTIREAAASKRGLDTWESKVVEYYGGRLSRDELVNAAGHSRERLCEAYYYIGELQFLAGRTVEAGASFEKCIATGVEGFIEYEFADCRLSQLLEARQ